MYIKILKSKIEGKKLTAIFYNDEKVPIKTVHVGAVVIQTILFYHTTKREEIDTLLDIDLMRPGAILRQVVPYHDIYYGNIHH